MLEIRWHSRAGQGAVTGAKGLGDVVARTGKYVQAFAFYGSAKRGAAMTAYNRIDDEVILNHQKFMHPDYVLVIDPGLTYTADITAYEKEETKYIITTHLSKEELIESQPKLKGRDVYVVDCIQISLAWCVDESVGHVRAGLLPEGDGECLVQISAEDHRRQYGSDRTCVQFSDLDGTN